MAFDYKKEYKEFYAPKGKPAIVDIPEMKFIAVKGKGNPNGEDSEYSRALSILYTLSFTLKMSYKGPYKIEGYFEYVVPPLEGFWWQEGIDGMDYSRKDDFNWISVIRTPDFITLKDFQWAQNQAKEKKKADCSKAEFITIKEGLCVQIMHIGAYDDEPKSVELMDSFISEEGYSNDFSSERLHHEIYLSDPRKVAEERRKTIIRHPIKKNSNEG